MPRRSNRSGPSSAGSARKLAYLAPVTGSASRRCLMVDMAMPDCGPPRAIIDASDKSSSAATIERRLSGTMPSHNRYAGAWRAPARASPRLLGATNEELAMHPAQKRIIDAMRRRVPEHRVHAAARAQRGLSRIDPRLDRQRRERSKTEEAAAAGAGLDLHPMLRRVLVGLGELRSDRFGRYGFGRCGAGHRHDGLQRSGGRGYHALVGHAYEASLARAHANRSRRGAASMLRCSTRPASASSGVI